MGLRPVIIGIDLGTTNSAACIRDARGHFHFFTPPDDGEKLVPSLFFHDGKGHEIVGLAVETEESSPRNCDHVVRHVKREMGQDLPRGGRPERKFHSHGREFSPSHISGAILKALRTAATECFRDGSKDFCREFQFEGGVDSAVITVPSYFGFEEREATRRAATWAGFSRVELLDEPVAAALSRRDAWTKELKSDDNRVLVIDLGGGTCDITLLRVGRAVKPDGFAELGRYGDNYLGGIDFDREIAKAFVYGGKKTGADGRVIEYSDAELDRLEKQATSGVIHKEISSKKEELCRRLGTKSNIPVPIEHLDRSKNCNIRADLTAEWFRKTTEPLVEYAAQLCDFLLTNIDRSEAGLKGKGTQAIRRDGSVIHLGIQWKEIDHILLVGGGSLMPHFQWRIQERWGADRKLEIATRPQEAVAEGAAVYAQMLGENKPLKTVNLPRCTYDIGVMYQPRPTMWEKFRRNILRQNVPLPPMKFMPLFHANSPLKDAAEQTRVWEASISNPSASSCAIPVCQRFVSLNGSADSGIGAQKSSPPFRISTLKVLRFRKKRSSSAPSTLELCMTYNTDHSVEFQVEYDGTSKRAKFDREAFEQRFDLDSDANDVEA